ncbi:site-specific DNA-methyltransferase [Sneathiella sp. HT1-7]|uniref:site-specific DNA-methyltransferase n=1 Tax=Sneathiella sp. HT1-7 TaxID=2887192 RepID=UPI001D158314|nr:DNA methyltransferase [Sneathiella sp. HT1-7]MCC3306737.1 site-specific DNA-methyltransferase [Sneathiella sp. HT1-7]
MKNNTLRQQRLDALTPYARNARTHSKKQIRQIADSIEEFGFTNPVLVDGTGGVIAGHGRIEAARLLGMESVPTLCLADLTQEQVRAYIIADNRLAELAGWDREILAIELQELLTIDLDFDITLTGFETPEIDILIGELEADASDIPEEDIPLVDTGPAITQVGDIWQIGKHRLVCGDATDADVYDSLLEGSKAQLVFTDPPYNVPVDGHVCGLGKVRHREFAMAAGEMDEEGFTGFLGTVFKNLGRFSQDGAVQFICMDWRHIGEMSTAGKLSYSSLMNICIWAKTNGGMGSLYRSQHELVFVFKAGTGKHINNVELGKHGRNRTNLWTYAGINSFGKTRDADLALHPTVKPVALVADAILDCSKRNGIVLDAFAGSGTTLMAAEKTGRRGYGIELDPRYCDVIVKRLAEATGVPAIQKQTGRTFDEMAAERTEDAGESSLLAQNSDHEGSAS